MPSVIDKSSNNTAATTAAIAEADVERTVESLTEKELLESICIQLKLMNLHLTELTGYQFKEHDVEK